MKSVGRFRYLEVPAPQGVRTLGTLVLIHGFPLSPTMWDPQLVLAEGGWRLIVPELRGFGAGSGDPPTTSVDDYAADILDLLHALHVDQAVICGLSMGGYIAFALHRHASSVFRGLLLADTRAEADPPEALEGRKRMQQLARDKGPAAIADELLPKLIGETTRRSGGDVIDRVRAQITGNTKDAIIGALSALMTRPDSTSTLSSIRCPTLIVVGDEDALTPPKFSQSMHAAIPGSQLVVLAGAGHMANMEQPAAFNEAVAHFLGHRV